MYGCTNPEEVLQAVRSCTRSFPSASSARRPRQHQQVQCSSFPAHRPTNDRTFAPVNGRQAGGDSSMGGGGGYGALRPPPPSSRTTPGKHLAASRRSRRSLYDTDTVRYLPRVGSLARLSAVRETSSFRTEGARYTIKSLPRCASPRPPFRRTAAGRNTRKPRMTFRLHYRKTRLHPKSIE